MKGHRRAFTVGVAVVGLVAAIYLAVGGVIGSEFLPHLDEGALWERGTLAPSTGPTESTRLANRTRVLLCAFPEATVCTSQAGRPDDGTDTTGFFNTEYFVGLNPKEQRRLRNLPRGQPALRGHQVQHARPRPGRGGGGSHSQGQRPFAIVIVGGLISDLVMSIFLLPTLYLWFAGPQDVLPEPDPLHLEEV